MPDKAAVLMITLLNGHDLLLFPSIITHLQDYSLKDIKLLCSTQERHIIHFSSIFYQYWHNLTPSHRDHL